MKSLPAIARYMRLPEEQLRYPIELIQQGYEPNYLAMYRPDELGGIDVETLARLKRAVEYETSLAAHKEKVLQTLQRDNQSSDAAASVIEECTSVSQVDAIVRSLRSKKNAKAHCEAYPYVETLGQAILMAQGELPSDMNAWVVAQTGIPTEQADEALQQTKRWLQLLLSEDPKLLLQLQRAVLKNAVVSLTILPEPAKGEEPETEVAVEETTHAVATSEHVEPVAEEVPTTPESAATEEAPAAEAPAAEAPSTESNVAVAPLIEQFHQGRKQNKAIRTKSLSEKQLSPRQRRRRWLRHILESYSKLKKPLRNLTPYQILVVARGIRSRIIDLNFQQDTRSLVQACRESLCPGRHPMHGMLMELAEAGLKELILPKLHQDVIAILEEDAHQELMEASVLHLQNNLLQRPVRGHRILMIDAVGIKTAAISIVDANGELVATAELPCNSSKPDVVSQNMSMLGQLVHQHRVTLIGLSNGPARRYLLPAVVELLKQSTEGSLLWTMVDRSGCDAYTQSRTSLIELPRIARRHRAAVWLAWRLQDPLQQILKVDPARLRLGSYQRELPQAELEHALQESVSATITKAGVDVLSVDADVLKRIPGMTDEAAERVVDERQQGTITNRETLMQCLRQVLTEMQARQAIGFLRVFGSDNPLDGTIIHPDDYRLAQRLIAHASFALPSAAPEGWQKPDYEKLAAAKAAVAGISVESMLADDPSPVVIEPKVQINPDFGKIAEESPVTEESPLAEADAVNAVTDTVNDVNTVPPLSESETPTATDSSPASETSQPAELVMPEIPVAPMPRPTLIVDAEKLARSWQVGRAKLMSVAASLQHPFADIRDFRFPVPLRSTVPSMDNLPAGTMLSALVVGVADFGVFVELGPDCSGLVHISRLASDYVEDPHMFVQIGDIIPVWVVNVDDKRKRVSVTAIPPGTEERKRDSQAARAGSPEDRQSSSRPPRSGEGHRGAPGAPTEARGRRDSNRPAGGQPARSGGPGGQGGRGGRPEGGRGGFAGKGRGNRDRQQADSNSGESTPRRPVRIDKPQPQKPITEAMQQGKEPLRSFSDLMQFMKQSKPDAAAEPISGSNSVPPPIQPPNETQRADTQNAPDSDPQSMGENQSLATDSVATDANTTA